MNITKIAAVCGRRDAGPGAVLGLALAWLKRRAAALGLVAALLAAGGAEALQINPSFVDGAGQTWNSTRRGVISQAIEDWELWILEDQTVDVTLTFSHAGTGGYLGQWGVSGSFYEGTDIYPWTDGVIQTIHFNVDVFPNTGSGYLWWDSTPDTADDQPIDGWDALSVARHEMGHMMGFTDGFYVDDVFTPSERNRWRDHIVGTTFDPGGLNVTMASAGNLGHVANSGSTAGDLMTPAQVNGVRTTISQIDLAMLALAHDYTIRTGQPGDLNEDGFVGQGDLDIVLSQWGRTGPGILDPRADVNGDEFVGQYDLDQVLESWGQGTQPPGVPEPATLGTFALGGIALLRRKRKSR